MAFDIIGDVHGCRAELEELLDRLGYQGVLGLSPSPSGDELSPGPSPERGGASDTSSPQGGQRRASSPTREEIHHPEGRQAIFVGDLTDRGPDSVGTVRLVYRMYRAGVARVAPGNHDDKLLRYLHGRNVRLQHGIETTVAEYLSFGPQDRDEFRQQMVELVGGSKHYLTLDGGRLIVAHAGIKQHMIGDYSGRTRSMVLYGDTTGRTDEQGFPERRDWAEKYRGKPLIVYGHTPVKEAVLRNNTINIDTGCVFGGKLTAFRYPEREIVQVPARRVYWPHARWEDLAS